MNFFPRPVAAELILGGARSGKSSHALSSALAWHGDVCWIATAQACDSEMRERIERHRHERPAHWRTIEEPLWLARALRDAGHAPETLIVVDCLTLWLSHCLFDATGTSHDEQENALLAHLAGATGQRILLVSNEVGSGIVPDNAVARQFRDAAGRLHQRIAACVPDVTLIQAGLPLPIKRAGQPCWI
ncbi:bifunctional adenosylcobinamide kinase/adenosylcobinamide-phosphate guanylyltransferase [Chitinilyticum aquatile]|uniref:bifunctional adenosylcobinamide kinase/adenosylcobinamide-phosphate guanylyltransferase n=1 Tax=Chitinilyticum aquatile TaxID=362520 RepID=UPI00041646B8|nr:bifunctional adenosylcobinamide kinase/adenosylcobinamide-phosphate guanylyltransferase [Chitinilyticum aquatile]